MTEPKIGTDDLPPVVLNLIIEKKETRMTWHDALLVALASTISVGLTRAWIRVRGG